MIKMVVHFLSVALTVFIVYSASPGSSLFSWHPLCMSIGFAFVSLQAILIFSPESSLLSTSTSIQEKKKLHWILHAMSFVLVIAGFSSVYLNKSLNERAHFSTYHSKFGLATCSATILTLFLGISNLYSLKLLDYIKPINVKVLHATLAVLVFVAAMSTMSLATYSNWFRNRYSVKRDVWIHRFAFWTPIILAVCVARQVTLSYLPLVLSEKESKHDKRDRKIKELVEAKLEKKKNKEAQQGSGSDLNPKDDKISDGEISDERSSTSSYEVFNLDNTTATEKRVLRSSTKKSS